MTQSAATLAQFRRMVDELTTATYSDALLTAYIETYPMMDERGVAPYYYDVTTNPPTRVATDGWYPTYDLNAAAAAVWEEKAAAVAKDFDFPTFTGIYAHSTVHENYKKQARYYAARRKIKTGTGIPWPSRNRRGNLTIVNQAEGLWDE